MDIAEIFKSSIKTRKARKNLSQLLTAVDIIYGEFEILFLLLSEQPLRPSIIGTHLHCEPAAVSRIIKSLSQKNLIDYQHDNEDRRQIYVSLTKHGHSIIKNVVSQSCVAN
jgi:DNA-binding MarR family transcriptional regulator